MIYHKEDEYGEHKLTNVKVELMFFFFLLLGVWRWKWEGGILMLGL